MKKGEIFSIMLVFLMMISFLPTNIYANDETKNIGQLVVTTYEQLENGLGDAADVSRNVNGKTLDGDCKTSTLGYVPKSLCLEHGSNSTMVLKESGTRYILCKLLWNWM